VSFPVSNGMRSALGRHPCARVLYPIPESEETGTAAPSQQGGHPFRMLYAGNLGEYGPMIALAMEESLQRQRIRLEVRGRNPAWPRAFQDEMRQCGLWLDFAQRHEFEEWFQSADAFLVPMVFDPAFRRRMETSFPSKLTEYSRYGRPLVVWGPEYSSAVQWGRETKAAICVTSPHPAALMNELAVLSADKSLREEMGRRARHAYESQFHPEILQGVFEEGLTPVHCAPAEQKPQTACQESQEGAIRE
jgi:glycosyltransferase involved in cell wall biosynthesis